MQHAASAITAPDNGQLPAYWRFHEAVTRAQLAEWLPAGRHLLVDVSGPRGQGAELAAKAGHTVLRVLPGAQADWFAEEELLTRHFQVTPASNRMGLRLASDALPLVGWEMVSEPVCPGTVQVTRDGQCKIGRAHV